MSVLSVRLARFRRLALREAEAVLVSHPPNVFYLVGFRGSSGVLALTRRAAAFFTDGRYRLQASSEVRGARVRVASGDPLAAAAGWLRAQGAARVAFEGQRVSVAQWEFLRRAVGSRAELRPARRRVEELRRVKDAEEIERIRAAQELTARVFEEVLPFVRPGVRELDLAAELEYRMKQHGASGAAFETIVASGYRAALPHARPTLKRLAKNELVIFDLGAILADYHSDMTRTVYLGTPSSRVKKTYRAVEEALARAEAAVRAGVPATRVDAVARGHLRRCGLGRYFTHGTGHGVGLETHEEPRLGAKATGKLAAGHVVTLEPGVYLPGWGGVRIEDVVAVRRRGAERLTPISRELIWL